jgi:flotillin
MIVEIGIGLAVLAVLVVLFIATYKVVEPNEAHVVVIMGSGRRYYGPAVDGAKSAYFFIPVIMKRFIMPLTNVKMMVEQIDLNDKEVAPFMCDVATWVRISNPKLAAERLDLNIGAFQSLRNDMVEIVQAIARAVSMKHEILDIMRDRKSFANSVSAEVQPILREWGVDLVGLEINTIRDAEDSSVIKDYESIREADIKTKSRIAVAEKDREAVENEQKNYKLSQVATAEAQQVSQQRFVEADRVVGIDKQNQVKDIANAEKEANVSKVEAVRKLDVGTAEVEKEALIQKATGEGEAVRIKGEKDANVITLTGNAEAEVIQKKGEATATAQEKLAIAQQQFNDASTNIEKIKAFVAIQTAYAEAYGHVAKNADLKIVSGGEAGNLFGIPLNAMTGAGLGQLLEGLDTDAISEAVGAITKTQKKDESTTLDTGDRA